MSKKDTLSPTLEPCCGNGCKRSFPAYRMDGESHIIQCCGCGLQISSLISEYWISAEWNRVSRLARGVSGG